jgi:hemoglobin
MPESANESPATVYELAGGAATFERIVDNFYAGVDTDPIIRPMYPEDLTDGKRHMTLFLMQYFGGPTTYSEERGHPRLRMRHIPFSIGEAERDAWLRHMIAAVEAEALHPEVRNVMIQYFVQAAHFMMNK